MSDHECVFVEEQEPSGRLVLPPCLGCGLTAMDALDNLRSKVEALAEFAVERRGKILADHHRPYVNADDTIICLDCSTVDGDVQWHRWHKTHGGCS